MDKKDHELLSNQDIDEISEENDFADIETLECEILDVAFSYGEHRNSGENS